MVVQGSDRLDGTLLVSPSPTDRTACRPCAIGRTGTDEEDYLDVKQIPELALLHGMELLAGTTLLYDIKITDRPQKKARYATCP